MKFLKFPLIALLCAGVFTLAFYGCKKDAQSPSLTSDARPVANSDNCANYTVTLVVDKTTIPGSTIFTWTIVNPNPGNGSGSTIQNLSHWDFVPSACLDQNWQDIVSASYNTGSGWQAITNFDIAPDPSLQVSGCSADDIFKFDQGTSGSTPTQYRLVLLGDWGTGDLTVYFKSGVNTGCCSKTFDNIGIGCPVSEDCSFSQGYWFSGVHAWNDVEVGGKTYTNAEGLAIWNSSNAGGITDSKKAFTQLAAIRLSGADETDPAISGAIATIDGWLGSISKLSPAYLPNQSAAEITTFGDARAAADAISAFINAYHCSE
jgi:hypothetical protein